MGYFEDKKLKLKEMNKNNEIELNALKKEWIEDWGEEHWNETQKTIEKMVDDINKWQNKNK